MKLSANSHAVVTGGTRGFGLAIAKRLALRCGRVTIVGRDESRLNEVVADLQDQANDCKVVGVVCDLSVLVDLEQAWAKIVADQPVDILVNNAGIYSMGPLDQADPTELQQMISVNLVAPLLLSRLALPSLVQQQSGAIINIGSVAAKEGFPANAGYCASKFGLFGFTKALFEEVRAAGVTVAIVNPGMSNTDMTAPMDGINRAELIAAEDVADAVDLILNAGPTAVPFEIDIKPQRDVFAG